jgi:hypothetical protein
MLRTESRDIVGRGQHRKRHSSRRALFRLHSPSLRWLRQRDRTEDSVARKSRKASCYWRLSFRVHLQSLLYSALHTRCHRVAVLQSPSCSPLQSRLCPALHPRLVAGSKDRLGGQEQPSLLRNYHLLVGASLIRITSRPPTRNPTW